MAEAQLPKYKSHREVSADKIVYIKRVLEGSEWTLACGAIIDKETVRELTKRSSPTVGDYFIQYEDGYKSWSPAQAFEEGYTKL